MNPTTCTELFLFSPQTKNVHLNSYVFWLKHFLTFSCLKIKSPMILLYLRFREFGRECSSSDYVHFSASQVTFKLVLKRKESKKKVSDSVQLCSCSIYAPFPSICMDSSSLSGWATCRAEECCSVGWRKGTRVRKLPPEAVLEVTIPGDAYQTAKAYPKYGKFADILGHFNAIVLVNQNRKNIGHPVCFWVCQSCCHC